MPELGSSEYVYVSDKPEVIFDGTWLPEGDPVVDIDMDVIPFNGEEYKGIIRCTAKIIDALKGYSYCKIEDENGDTIMIDGWVVNIDPFDASPVDDIARSSKVKYFVLVRRNFADSKDFRVESDSVRKLIEKAKASGKKYIGFVGYVYPPEEFYAEIRKNPKLAKERAEKLKRFEEEIEKILEM